MWRHNCLTQPLTHIRASIFYFFKSLVSVSTGNKSELTSRGCKAQWSAPTHSLHVRELQCQHTRACLWLASHLCHLPSLAWAVRGCVFSSQTPQRTTLQSDGYLTVW